MSVIPPWAMDSVPADPQDPTGDRTPEYDGASLRAIYSALLSGGQTPTTARPGVISGLDVSLTGDTVHVGSGLIVVTTSTGSYVTGLSEEQSFVLDARHSTNDRIDRLVFEIVHTDTERLGRMSVIAGTPAPNPQAPAIPDDAENLGTIDVPSDAGGPAAFTPQQRYTAGRGGIITAPNLAALDRVADGSTSAPAFATVGGDLFRSVGSGWEPLSPTTTVWTGDDVITNLITPDDPLGSQGAHATVTEFAGGFRLVTLSVHWREVPLEDDRPDLGSVAPELRPAQPVALTGYAGGHSFLASLDTSGNVELRYHHGPGSWTNVGVMFSATYAGA